MVLWTIQPLCLYENLLLQGTLYCNPSSGDFWGLYSQEFRDAYDWLVEQMKVRVGASPEGVKYPFWAWALIDGVSKKPDLRRVEFNNYVGENVVLELDIRDTDVLLSDEVNWHYVLNNSYLHDVHEPEDDWERTELWFDNLSPNEKQTIKQKSWERIFDEVDPDNDWDFVQATFWALKLEQVKSVRRFWGRGKEYSKLFE